MQKKNLAPTSSSECLSLKNLVLEKCELQKEILEMDREIQRIQEPQLVKKTESSAS